jgi:hypothetical protein
VRVSGRGLLGLLSCTKRCMSPVFSWQLEQLLWGGQHLALTENSRGARHQTIKVQRSERDARTDAGAVANRSCRCQSKRGGKLLLLLALLNT